MDARLLHIIVWDGGGKGGNRKVSIFPFVWAAGGENPKKLRH